ncbi:predicted protein [Nematostella vectensis]|uniref:Sigma non-opioid intracellular receptor 1 n=2 Tax=Nematostella vectensis TaxID=45351 RepID=A7RQH9_NEMVE|nr:predicted protein [Nematostella vectensis]|eukprot:XP_001638433.1 predicted protein [Nematostella vectensis]
MGFTKSFIFFCLWACLAIFCVKYWMKTKTYVFDAKDISDITKKHLKSGGSPERIFGKVAFHLDQAYPGHILPVQDQEWVFMYAGGWKASMCLLHASLTEYILFFGTAVDTSGHSGRYWANISDTLISGKFTQWKEGSLQTTVYKPGDHVIHVQGEVTVVSWEANTWMVEYGRGFLPSALGFTLSDTVFSSQDIVHVGKILYLYAKALWQELLLFGNELKS